jgi:hypothetical protein
LLSILIVLFIGFTYAQTPIQGLELFSSDNSIPTKDIYQCFLANLNCSAFSNSVIQVDLNRPYFKSLTGQAAMFLSTAPFSGGCCAPFPDPAISASYTYTTFLPNGTVLPNVQFTGSAQTILYITVWCFTSQCEYNVAISQTSGRSLTPKHDIKVSPVKESTTMPTYEVLKLNLRNKITTDGMVLYNNYTTVAIAVCGATLAGIYGDSATVCFEATVFGLKIGYLFYQQITTSNTYLPINLWYQRAPDDKEPIRDLTGAFRLPINRYRTMPIPIQVLQNMSSVYQTIIGYGGEGENDPQPNYYATTYEWFACTS